MRMINVFLGSARRNDGIKLADPHPVPRYADSVHSGNAGLDGYTLLSRADPTRQGQAPFVARALAHDCYIF